MLHKTQYLRIVVIGLFSLLAPGSVFADEALPPQTLFKNVNIFNGTDDRLYENHYILVENNLIKAISASEIKTNSNANVIDGQGKALMPGLIDSRVHLTHTLAQGGITGFEMMIWKEVGALAYHSAQEYLYSGFTTVRDLCGSHDGLRRHIEAGTLIGPRIYLSGACISQTSGHGDWRPSSGVVQKIGNETSHVEYLGIVILANGADAVLIEPSEPFHLS